jgi:hypothetical protein
MMNIYDENHYQLLFMLFIPSQICVHFEWQSEVVVPSLHSLILHIIELALVLNRANILFTGR